MIFSPCRNGIIIKNPDNVWLTYTLKFFHISWERREIGHWWNNPMPEWMDMPALWAHLDTLPMELITHAE